MSCTEATSFLSTFLINPFDVCFRLGGKVLFVIRTDPPNFLASHLLKMTTNKPEPHLLACSVARLPDEVAAQRNRIIKVLTVEKGWGGAGLSEPHADVAYMEASRDTCRDLFETGFTAAQVGLVDFHLQVCQKLIYEHCEYIFVAMILIASFVDHLVFLFSQCVPPAIGVSCRGPSSI